MGIVALPPPLRSRGGLGRGAPDSALAAAGGRIYSGTTPMQEAMDLLRQRARRLRNTATGAERHLWQHLRLKQLGACRFRRRVPVAGYIVDFPCIEHRLIVELDVGQHLEQSAYDQKRTLSLEAMGHRVLRYWNDELLLHTCSVLEVILRALELSQTESRDKVKVRCESRSESTPPQSSPALRAREGAENSSNSNSNSSFSSPPSQMPTCTATSRNDP